MMSRAGLPPTLPILLLLLCGGTKLSAQHPPGVEPGETYHRVFVSDDAYGITGDPSFPPPAGVINGFDGADWNVTFAAARGNLFTAQVEHEWFEGNTLTTPFKALLSTSTVDAHTRMPIEGPVYNTQDEKVADNHADFWDGSLDAAIRYDAQGNVVSTEGVWSGSTSLGEYTGNNCGDWTDNSTFGEYGNASSSASNWLSQNAQSCSNTARVYGISPAITLPDSADFDLDGSVTGLDFLTLQRGLGTVGPAATHAAGDANGDDVIDTLDVAVWESQYGLVVNELFTDEAAFLAAVDGEVLQSFEALAHTNTRSTTGVGTPDFGVTSPDLLGVWGPPATEFDGTFATDGDKWIVSPQGGSLLLQQGGFSIATAIGLNITDFGDQPGDYDLVAEVTFYNGDTESYTIASSGQADGGHLFWGISTTTLGSRIVYIELTYGPNDEIGLDEVYYVPLGAPLTAGVPVPEPASLALVLTGLCVAARRRR